MTTRKPTRWNNNNKKVSAARKGNRLVPAYVPVRQKKKKQ